MYESPIQLIMNDMYKQIQVEQENTVYKAIQSIGVNVDKDELIKALNYDRKQYQKGYKDGRQHFAYEFYKILTEDCTYYNPDAPITMKTIVNILDFVKRGE
jgi:hypothetical protein